MAGFTLNDILNGASQAPAAVRLEIVNIPLGDIRPNPENQKIYRIGDVGALKADILANGLRQPLEVIPAEDGSYTLLGGERRWTAMGQLLAEGQERFARVPCIVRQSRGAQEDLLALITANATARELTDGERLAQYEALKGIFEAKKAAGALEGRVRDAMAEALGVGTGTLGRLNAISEHCTDEVKAMLRDGKTTLAKAYDASKLWPRQQAEYCSKGYAPSLPDPIAELAEQAYAWAAESLPYEGIDWMKGGIVDSGFRDWSSAMAGKEVRGELASGPILIRYDHGDFVVYFLSKEDARDAFASMRLWSWRLFDRAREAHLTPEQKAALAAQAEALAPGPAAGGDSGNADAPGGTDVSTVDTREQRLDGIVEELLTGELPGKWTLMRKDDVLHFTSYILDLPNGQFLFMLDPEGVFEDLCGHMYLRVDARGHIVPMDAEDPDNTAGWLDVNEFDWMEDAVRGALREAAELLLDGEDKAGEG